MFRISVLIGFFAHFQRIIPEKFKLSLAEGKEAIDEYLEKLIPFMAKHGGFIPTCDHGVPDNVSFDNYMHYRKRVMELDS